MQDDGWDKLVWKISYMVDWKDFILPQGGNIGPVPAYITGKGELSLTVEIIFEPLRV